MDDYQNAANELKEMIIEGYLKKHPEVKRSELVTKLVNGKIVVGTIGEIFGKMAQRKDLQDLEERKKRKLLGEVTKSGDERHEKILTSLRSSLQYIHWLATSCNTGFSKQEQEENIHYLKKQKQLGADRAIGVYQAKMKILEAMRQASTKTKSLVQTLTFEYLEAVRDQLKVQANSYKREVQLGDHFSNTSKQFIQSAFSRIRTKMQENAMLALKGAVEILKKDGINVGDLNSNQDIQKLNQALLELEERLETRRHEFKTLHEIVTYLDEVIKKLKAEMGETEGEESTESEAKKDTQTYRRMAYTSKNKRYKKRGE